MRRVAVIASASGNGKTTLGRALGERLGVPFVELDALVHGPNWVETPDAELREKIRPTLELDGWVIDGSYQRKLGNLVLDAADTIVWLDLPMHVWFPRLVRRTWRRWTGREALWNGNRETLRSVLWSRDSLFRYALRSHFRRRRELPDRLAQYRVIRLRTPAEVAQFLDQAASVMRTV
jgi:adenylate kinase family enzyme